jgi:hypothetical protein
VIIVKTTRAIAIAITTRINKTPIPVTKLYNTKYQLTNKTNKKL